MDAESQGIIDKLSKISEVVSKDIKPLVQKLAKNIGNNLNKEEIKIMAKNEGIENPQLTDVASIINRLRKKHNWAFGKTTLYSYIQPEYKNAESGEYTQTIRLNENYVESHYDEVKDLLKRVKDKHQPSKDIISKAKISDMERYDWKCWFAQELAWMAIKMEQDHQTKHDDSMCKEYAKRAKTTRDSRFATDMNSYEAIILAMNSAQSLKNAIAGEWEFKTLWEIIDDMGKCTECLGFKQCEKEKCKHECHRVVRPMTTKGLKYAIKTNDKLHDWDKQVKRLIEIKNDLCRIGKIILDNPKTKKLLGETEMRKMINAHIERDDCIQCDLFLEKNPQFFKKVI